MKTPCLPRIEVLEQRIAPALTAASISLGALNGANGTTIVGAADLDGAGSSVSGIGDVNGDGFADLIVGASQASGGGSGCGSAFLIYGKGNLGPAVDVTLLDGTNGFAINGVGDGDRAGVSVGGAGDVNGDGFSDVIVGADFARGTNHLGAAYVVFGGANGGIAGTVSLSGLTGPNGFAMTSILKNSGTGSSVSTAGDLNGDGYSDVVIGAVSASQTGLAYVVYGNSGGFGATVPFSGLDGQNGFTRTGVGQNDFTGGSVSTAGDVNHDGYADLLVGATKAKTNGVAAGAAYLVYGGPSGSVVQPTIATGGKTATFTDLDGDLVTVKSSKGGMTKGAFDLLQPAGAKGARFLALDVTGIPTGSDVTITAKHSAAGGDDRVELGFLDSTAHRLGAVKIGGNVEQVKIGDNMSAALVAKSLTVQSLGKTAVPAHDTGKIAASTIAGKAGAITIQGDLTGVELDLGGAPSVVIGGSLIGDATPDSGLLGLSGFVPTVKIGHDVRAGEGSFSGTIFSSGKLGAITVGGSLLGSRTQFAGIGGSAGVAAVTIGHDLHDAEITSSSGSIGKVVIGGSFVGTFTNSVRQTKIACRGTLGSVLSKGDVVSTADREVIISGGGANVANATTDLAIGSVAVLGSVDRATILGGYDVEGSPLDGHAQIGKVSVQRNWAASSIVAGLKHGNGQAYNHFAAAGDTMIAAGQSKALARIASIVIKGTVSGTPVAGDHFGFAAQDIGALQIGATKFALKKNAADTIALGVTNDFSRREI